MSQPRVGDADDWPGRLLVDCDGLKLGTIADVYFDEPGGRPQWILIHTGFFGVRETLVPARDARPAGDALRVPYRKTFLESGPNVDLSTGLSADERAQLATYYGPATEDAARPSSESGGTIIAM